MQAVEADPSSTTQHVHPALCFTNILLGHESGQYRSCDSFFETWSRRSQSCAALRARPPGGTCFPPRAGWVEQAVLITPKAEDYRPASRVRPIMGMLQGPTDKAAQSA